MKFCHDKIGLHNIEENIINKIHFHNGPWQHNNKFQRREGSPNISAIHKIKYGCRKNVTVGNLLPLKFLGVPIRQGRKCNNLGAWYPERSIVVATEVGITVEEDLLDIMINDRKVMINIECDYLESWIRSLG